MTPPRSGAERLARRGFLGLAAGLTLAACARAGLPDGAAAPADASRLVEVDGVALAYVRAGAGPPVVLIHGASGNLRDWTLVAMQAVAERHDVIAFDRPGHGRSGWPGPEAISLSGQARLMRAALAALGVRRATLVGHSYGGSVALAWALDAPESVDGLLLVSAPSQVWPGGLGLSTDLLANPLSGPVLAQAAGLLPDSVAERVIARVFAPQPPTPGYFAHLRPELVLAPSALRANARQLAALKDEIRAMAPRYPMLAPPLGLVHGTADETVPVAIHSEPLAAQVPGARLIRLAGIGHMPHHVALPDVLAALGGVAPA